MDKVCIKAKDWATVTYPVKASFHKDLLKHAGKNKDVRFFGIKIKLADSEAQ